MSRVFAELYLDEDVDVLVAEVVRARGFAATTTVEAGNLGAPDADQLEYAASRQLTFVTHNREDFKVLHEHFLSAGRHHYGIVVSVRRSPIEITRRLLVILNSLTADELENQIIFI